MKLTFYGHCVQAGGSDRCLITLAGTPDIQFDIDATILRMLDFNPLYRNVFLTVRIDDTAINVAQPLSAIGVYLEEPEIGDCDELTYLRQFHNTTINLWATDKEPVEGDPVRKELFFQIKSNLK